MADMICHKVYELLMSILKIFRISTLQNNYCASSRVSENRLLEKRFQNKTRKKVTEQSLLRQLSVDDHHVHGSAYINSLITSILASLAGNSVTLMFSKNTIS
jgi:hypothetical protein